MSVRPAGNEAQWEKRLNIRTAAGSYEKDDSNHSRYEPTAYAVLGRLAESGYLRPENKLVDYGCGKGRVGFYLNRALGIRTVGVEYNERLHAEAQENMKRFAGGRAENIRFVLGNAENYEVTDEDIFYFFNPFSERILRSVISRILESYYARPRRMLLLFYYALDSYLDCLGSEDALTYEGEIDCRDLFEPADEREKILIYSVGQGELT